MKPFSERVMDATGVSIIHHRHGRRRPFTAKGIERLPCVRCGHPAFHQWQACADKGLYRPLCLPCDVDLNALVLGWVGDPEAAAKMATYRTAQQKLFLGQIMRLEEAGRKPCPRWVARLT